VGSNPTFSESDFHSFLSSQYLNIKINGSI
jgi:hypothetical protein